MPLVVSIEHLQTRLIRLMEQVQLKRYEDPRLRAEVLLAMNQLCSPELLLGLWQTLEEASAREEMMLVRLLKDLESVDFGAAQEALLLSGDPGARSIGYGVAALRGRGQDASYLLAGLSREPELVIARGGRPELAPYSFLSSLLAGAQELEDCEGGNPIWLCLEAYEKDEDELKAIDFLLQQTHPIARRLGFVTLASRLMARVHDYAYDLLVAREARSLSPSEKARSRAMLERAPEIIEALATPGPAGLDGPEFVHARVGFLRELGCDCIEHLVQGLIAGRRELMSHQIERQLAQAQGMAHAEKNLKQSKTLGFLLALIVGQRAGVAAFIEGFSEEGELETLTLGKLLELSGERHALNTTMSLLAHWHQLQANEAAFKRWVESLWHDDRHGSIDEALDAALARPDETAIYAARIIKSVADPLGSVLRQLSSGQVLELRALNRVRELPRFLPAVLACLRDSESKLHPSTYLALARIGLSAILPVLNACERQSKDPTTLEQIHRAQLLLSCQRATQQHELFQSMEHLGLRRVEQEIEPSSESLKRLPPDSGAARALASPLGGRHMLRVYYWLPETEAPAQVGARPFGGYAARVELVVDLHAGRVHHSSWFDSNDLRHSPLQINPTPPIYQEGFAGLLWETPIEFLEERLHQANSRLWAAAPLSVGAPAATRSLVSFGANPARIETDELGRFFRVLNPTKWKGVEEALSYYLERYGRPQLQTKSTAQWVFEDIVLSIKQDPAFDTLAQIITLRRS